MTAEIVIMNLEAIALAADSAITIDHGNSQRKVYSSANKLFALSDIAPVGILVYGNASFMGIPWETVIKEYRYNLGNDTYDSLEGYYTGFCEFLRDETCSRFDEVIEIKFACDMVKIAFGEIEREVEQLTRDVIFKESETTGVVDFSNIEGLEKEFRNQVVEKYVLRANEVKKVIDLSKEFKEKFKDRIKEIKKSVFEVSLPRGVSTKLTNIGLSSLEVFTSDLLEGPSIKTGIAIAGFGDKEYFPSIARFSVEGIIDGKLKFKEDVELKSLDQQSSSLIVSLAQTDMVQQFMEGISSAHLAYLHDRISFAMNNYASAFSSMVDQLVPSNNKELHDKLLEDLKNESESIINDIVSYSDEEFSYPIVSVVEYLPKEQLAEMAESLVSLTALKRRFSAEETVGGPIDVAIITKGDGLIWSKRKHYFDPDINPSYFEKLAHRRNQNK